MVFRADVDVVEIGGRRLPVLLPPPLLLLLLFVDAERIVVKRAEVDEEPVGTIPERGDGADEVLMEYIVCLNDLLYFFV